MQWRNSTWKLALPLAILLMITGLGAWNNAPGNRPGPGTDRDTVPERDLDRELRAIENARKSVERVGDIDFEKIQGEIQRALKEVDLDHIKLQTEAALKKADAEKIRSEVENALASIDMDRIRESLQESLSSEDVQKQMEKVKQELEAARQEMEKQWKDSKWQEKMQKEWEKINTETIRKEWEKSRGEMDRLKKELEQQKVDFKFQMKKASQEMDRAETELRGYQEMIYAMEKQGLLSTAGDYSIQYRQGKLSINGKEQPENINRQYSKYFSRNSVTIRKRDGDINILND